MKRSMLYNWQKTHGARMTEFAGWEMPISFTSITDEHQTVREQAGVFDLSHMGRIRIRGDDRIRFLQHVFTNDIEELPEGGIHYGFLCNPQGGIVDDVTVYNAENYIMIVVNACNIAKVHTWLQMHAPNFRIEIEDSSISILMLAIQGPRAMEIVNEVGGMDYGNIKKYSFTVRQIYRAKAVISRTGYTGEDGFEIYCGSMYLPSLWERFLDVGKRVGLKPVGLGARDTLRTEACLPLYGHELDEQTTPLEAGLEKFVKMSKKEFIGKSTLMFSSQAEFARRLVCFEMLEKAIPRPGQTVTFEGEPIGKVTSGTFSPSLKKGIGMAYVDQLKAKPDTLIKIQQHDKLYKAMIRSRPLYKRRKAR